MNLKEAITGIIPPQLMMHAEGVELENVKVADLGVYKFDPDLNDWSATESTLTDAVSEFKIIAGIIVTPLSRYAIGWE